MTRTTIHDCPRRSSVAARALFGLGYIFLLLAAATLPGCGGGHANMDLSEDQMTTALDNISRKIDSLPGTDATANNQAVLAYLKSQPEIADSGLSDDGCV